MSDGRKGRILKGNGEGQAMFGLVKFLLCRRHFRVALSLRVQDITINDTKVYQLAILMTMHRRWCD